MTKTEVTVTEVKTIYVAFDGKEFPTEQDCKSYESAFLEEKAKEIAEKLPHFTFTPDWTDPDVEWDWYFISSKEELNAVRNYLYFDDASAWEYEPTVYPCWLAFSLESDGYGDIEGTPGQVFNALDEFKKSVNEKIETYGTKE